MYIQHGCYSRDVGFWNSLTNVKFSWPILQFPKLAQWWPQTNPTAIFVSHMQGRWIDSSLTQYRKMIFWWKPNKFILLIFMKQYFNNPAYLLFPFSKLQFNLEFDWWNYLYIRRVTTNKQWTFRVGYKNLRYP